MSKPTTQPKTPTLAQRECPGCGDLFTPPRRYSRSCSIRCRGVLSARNRPRLSTAERFWSKVEKTPTCWIWIGPKNREGYGTLNVDNRMRRAPRLSWELHHSLGIGSLGKDVFVLHRCDIPACVNPSHLFTGTHQDNMDDMKKKGRSLVGAKSHRSKLTNEQVVDIRRRHADGETQSALSREIGVSLTTIHNAIKGKTWFSIRALSALPDAKGGKR